MLIFAPFVRGHRDGDRAAARAGLELCKQHDGWTVLEWECRGAYDYADGLEYALGLGLETVIVEHDMAVHPWHITELENCSSSACVFAYYVGTTRSGDVAPELAHRLVAGGLEIPIAEGIAQAHRVSLGLAKIAPSALEKIVATPRVPKVNYTDLAWMLSVRLDTTWHVHWPAVAHHHWRS